MRKGTKQAVSLALAAVMTMGTLAGCGDSKTESSQSGGTAASTTSATTTRKAGDKFWVDEPLTVTMLYNDNPAYPLKNDWLLWNAIKKATNVTIKYQSVAMSDYDAKRSLLISSGDAPQIIPKTYPGSETQFIPSGTILPVSDYIDKMPNYKEKVEKWDMKDELKSIMQRDGKYYVLPGLHEKAKIDYSYLIRTDVLKELNLKVPTTYDEFYNVLKAIKAKYPNKYPFSDRFKGDSTLSLVADAFNVGAGWSKGNYCGYDWTTKKAVFNPATQNYKDFVTYMHKLVAEKLMDPESFSQTDDQATAKFTKGDSFVMNTNTQFTQQLTDTMNESLGKGKFSLEQIVPPTGEAGAEVSGSRLENGIMLNASIADDPRCDDILGFIDWLWYSDAGQTLTKWGVEGTTYTEKNNTKTLESGITFNGINPSGKKDLRKDYGFSGGVFSYGGSLDLENSLRNDQEKAYFTTNSEKLKLKKATPPVLFTDDEREQANSIINPLTDYVDSMTQKFILGTADINKDWDSFLKSCEQKGSQKLVDMINKTYDETKDVLNKD
ncbi:MULTISPECIES: ABC transporter substrate-binding protein [Caproicibacterium]|uniref:Extracellular solute-binding protein n=1 Tax=Caproicibacterium argilliputei TaxID=3030016 RepID=A0AA97DBB6_9FIRM|nr:extracellular solute-binding protein [Caproicibacterium argilliputei]WOC32639.1 extracellular solute-binding protein [Caproicibacterium argilliputei]